MSSPSESRSLLTRSLDRIEQIGNKLPDPLTLFVGLAFLMPVVSWLVSLTGWQLVHPGTQESIQVVNLLAPDQIQHMFTDSVKNFTGFPPLGTVLVAMIGIGVAERSGLIKTMLKMMVSSVPGSLISAALVFAGVMSSMAADAGYVVLTPLGAVLFAGLGRHPLAGLAAAFAGVSGGFSANLLLTSLDPLLAGFTESAAQIYDPAYAVAPTANFYFMFVSVFLVTLVGWFVTDKIVEPRLGQWDPAHAVQSGDGEADEDLNTLHPAEKKAAWAAFGVFALTLIGFAALVVPANGILRDAEGGLGPFYHSLVIMICLGFLFPSLVYGAMTGSIRNDRDVARMTGDTMASMGAYVVLAFAAAQFVAFFTWSNLGLMFAISGAALIQTLGIGGIPLLLIFMVISGIVNLFIGSASAKWAIMAPVFVPMLMNLGYSPEIAQVTYRIGDSITNIITPLLPYFPIVVAFAQRYDQRVRLGTLIAAMLPYSIAFALAWTVMLIVWYVLGLPLGPGAGLFYTP
ncbi:MAG: AbgT family transporter [Candidatus Sericytochromatia bacterium]|nr:AbgT family transporter [Candidatus Sericytochromatia bacterium]